MGLNLFIAPVVMVIVEAVKRTEKIDTKWLPLLALALGLATGTVFAIVEPEEAAEHVINGLLYGAAAAGIYDVAKSSATLTN